VRLYHEALSIDAVDGSAVQGLLDRAMREYLEVAMVMMDGDDVGVSSEVDYGDNGSGDNATIQSTSNNTASNNHPRRVSTRRRTASGTKK
jgi:hypothetical protein